MSLKKSNNEFDSINNESIYHTELARKDKQILILRNRINNLVLNKNSLISQFDNSKQKNIPSLKNISPKNNLSIKTKLISSIQTLKYENSLLRNKMGLTKKIEDKYSDTIKYKLLSAQKEIDNLTIMNTNKDNIIMNMQNFINNLNNIICNGKINLNLEQIDIKTFIKNLKKLEQKNEVNENDSKSFDKSDINIFNFNMNFKNYKKENDITNEEIKGKRRIIRKIKINRGCIYFCFFYVRKRKNLQNVLIDEGMKLIVQKLDLLNLFRTIFRDEKIFINFANQEIIKMSDNFKNKIEQICNSLYNI
jgi:hypothetical protein